jgi:hypothetical protein
MSTAWTVLGKDWKVITEEILACSSIAARVEKAEKLLEEAKKLAKNLMIANHPDKNLDDSDADVRFKTVVEAISVIEANTMSMRKKFENMKQRDENRMLSNGFITIK